MLAKQLLQRGHEVQRFLAAACLALAACPASANDADDLGEGYAHLVSFAAEPAIAGETFEIDSESATATRNEIEAYRLPLYREFGDRDEWRWFGQAALSAVRLESELTIPLLPGLQPLVARPEYTAYTGMVQGGVVSPLTDTVSLLAGAGVGWSRLENQTYFSDPLFGDLLDQLVPQRLFDWEADAGLIRGDLGLRHDTRAGKLRFKNRLDLVVSYVESVDESAEFDPFSGRSSTLSFQSDVSRPLPLAPAGHPIYLLAGIGGFVFLGDGREQLGFTELFQASVGVGYRQFALRFSAVFGADVQGAGFSLDYGY